MVSGLVFVTGHHGFMVCEGLSESSKMEIVHGNVFWVVKDEGIGIHAN
jgi:hypothetical protein